MVDTFDIVQLAKAAQNSNSANIRQLANYYLSGGISAEEFLTSFVAYTSISAVAAQEFETLYPKQTAQLIKIGQDLTYFGQKDVYRSQEINDLKSYYESKFSQVSGQLVSLGEGLTAQGEAFQSSIEDINSRLGSSSNGGLLGGVLGGIGGTGLIILAILFFMSRGK